MRIRPLLRAMLLTSVVAAVTAPAAHAAPLTASFDHDPAAPAPGQTITFTSTTSGGGTAPIRLAWDLDDDGDFDDGTTQQVTAAYPAGDHVVRLRARQVGAAVVEDVETRTVHVEAAPAPTPPPDPTPTPAGPGADPGPNQPPTAVIDDLCLRLRRDAPATCTAALTQVGKAKNFKATKSSDADGKIVRHEWDLDGDGTFETDSGSTAETSRTYQNLEPVTVRLRVTDDRGATAETSLALRKLEPACSREGLSGQLRFSSPCFKRYVSSTGVTTFTSAFPVHVNGIAVAPKPGRLVTIRLRKVTVPQAGGGAFRIERFELVSNGAEASIPVKSERVVLDRGSVSWTAAGKRLTGLDLPAGQKLNGLDVTGMTPVIELPSTGTARPAFWLRLPAQLGAPSSGKPVPVTVRHEGGLLPSGATAVASAGEPLSFDVPSAAIGPIGLKKLTVTYDGDDYWAISAGMAIPAPLAAEITGEAGIRGGAFDHAGVEATFPNGLGPIGPVYLTRIAFRVEIKPKMGTKCMPTSYGTPTLALCGEIGLSAGPPVAGKRALGIDGGLGFATYDGKPSIFRAYGEATLAAIKLASANIEVHTNGYVNANASFKWGVPGWVNLSGGLAFEMLGSKFNASGHVDACLEFVDWCAGATALVSSKGIAACLHIDLWLDTWEPGFGYKWNGAFTPYFSGCDIGPYKEKVAAAAAQSGASRAVTLPAGLPGAAFAVEGATGAPVVTLIGPDGERISAPREPRVIASKEALVVPDPRAKLTQIAVVKPAPGRWQVVTEDGSPAITSLKVAEGLPEPKVSARVVRRGSKRALRYTVDAQPGQVVTFSERGASAGTVIGTAKGARGELRFTPADGAAETRRIVAVVTQDGQLRAESAVASYRAPAAARAGAVRALKLRRKGTTVQLRWTPAPRAVKHQVAVTLASGRRVVALVKGRSFAVRGTARGTRVQAAVHGVTASGMAGKAARRTLR